MPGEPSHFERVEALFERVMNLDPPERERALDEAAEADKQIVSEVRHMIAADSAIGSSLESPPLVSAGAIDRARPSPEINGFTILRRIGAGGMGIVFEADQQSPRRRVALKLIRSGLLSENLLRRFALESEALGRLQHPGIAQIFEAGTSETGEPYFAMEFVEGKTLIDYAREHGLDRRERLELFAEVCDAVQHAHQKGVVHRDLKPSNILVNAAGEPKVLDFGVARLIDDEMSPASIATQAGQLVGTIAYMSPEQAAGDADRIDTRADVYSLGVILYELLSGRLPVDVDGTPLLEALNRVRQHEPARLGSFDTRCRGDVETIVGKALAKEPEHRYGSAAELAEDIRRHLNDQPINARPPTASYHFRKFARRNKTLVAASAIVCLTVLGALGVVSFALDEAVTQRAIADEQRAEARAQAAITTEVSRFMHLDLLSAIVPGKEGADVTVREVVDTAAAEVDASFPERPEISGAVHATLGNIYNAIGSYPEAERELLLGVDQLEASLGPGHELSVFARDDLGSLYRTMGRLDDARVHIEAAIEHAEEAFGPDDERTLSAVIGLSDLEREAARFDEAIAALERVRDAVPEDHDLAVAARNALGGVYFETRQYNKAEPLYREMYEHRLKTRGESHPLTLAALNNVAAALEGLGRYDEAEPMYRKILDAEEEALGVGHPETLVTKHNLAFLLESMGRYEEAEPLYRTTLAACREVFGPEHPGTLTCTRSLSSLLVETGQAEEAERLLNDALPHARAALGPAHPLTANLEFGLGSALREQGSFEEAAAVYERAAPTLAAAYGPAEEMVLNAQLGAARSRLDAGDPERAEAAARGALTTAEDAFGPGAELTLRIVAVLADACEQLGKPEEAEALRGRLPGDGG
ncbi:MAG: tetratricopeptide repeat-containing serine/threonine-protein kinase [Phycisphaerales bacterium]